jgi:MFS transporter, ACS family, D-galactonate transporter
MSSVNPSVSRSGAEPPPVRAPRRRWLIAFVLGFGVLVNYFDRVNLSVAKEGLFRDFGISNVAFGYLLSAYNWTYAALQLPSGVLLDLFGVQIIGRISPVIWAAACFGGAFAPGLRYFFASRLLLGVGEAPTFPANSKATGYWFPRKERSLATAIFDSSAKFAAGIGTLTIGMVVIHFGWRFAFALTGVASLLYFLAFFVFYRDPDKDKKLSPMEREYLVRNGAVSQVKGPDSGVSLLYLMGRRKILGLSLGFAAYNYCFYLMLTWLPSYFTGALHLSLHEAVIYTSIPWFFATGSDLLFGGWLVDALVKRHANESLMRQLVLVGGMVVGLALLGPIFTRTPSAAVFWITLSICGLAASAPVAWTIPSLIAPRDTVGKVGGIMNFANQIAAIAAPVLTGYLIGAKDDFSRAFMMAAGALIVGIFGYAVLLGRIEQLPEPASLHAAGEQG